MGPKGMWEYGKVEVEPSGKVTVLSGASPHGQGQETSFAQIVADELGVEMDAITVVHGDTAAVPKGIGTFGSRATAVGGIAVYQAAGKVKEKARALASHLLEVDADDLNFSEGSLMDYALPRAADLPRLNLTRTETPTPVNPLGIKGIGEAGTIGSTPAVVNAVVDALAPFGVTHIDMPLTPQKIWSLCEGKKAAGSGARR